MPIGVFDSGLGGLTVLRKLQSEMPEQAFTYLGDNKNTPYGTRDAYDVFDLTCKGVQHLFDQGCDLVIIACNTASASALHRMQVSWLPKGKQRVLGVFVPMIEHLTQRDWGDNAAPTHTGLKNVAVFATQSTISSGAFPREMKFRARDVEVFGQACDGLVDAIEKGDRVEAENLVKRHVATMLAQLPLPQAAVLGCTHYPIVEDLFRAALPASTRLVSQPDLVASATRNYISRHSHFAEQGPVRYLTTGNVDKIRNLAQQFLGKEVVWEKAEMAG
ncbi:MAG: aspartate/glutamate racemase family protein [Rhodobacteraceae bacterium]|nr:aspartate/glutamate racemase family protein [Paracoccaceae bacterium]